MAITEKTLAFLLDLRPERVVQKLGHKSSICLLSSHDIFRIVREFPCVIMTCNIRIRHVISGIMKAAQELDAIVGFELAKSEGNLAGGYSGQTPEIFFNTVVEYADKMNFSLPFFIHGDHITVKDTTLEEIEDSRTLIQAQIEAGYTSFAIDASYNSLEDNIRITSDLAQPIKKEGYGLEVEVGEIKPAGYNGQITTVEEAVDFINGLRQSGVTPNLLAINNGAKHGNYLADEVVFIDLERTGEIYKALQGYGISLAQHGITGTPLEIIQKFASYGIRKGNVGTQWQNIAYRGLPANLMEEMKQWAKENNKNIKFATKHFKERIDNIPLEYRNKIARMAYEEAKILLKAFNSINTASRFAEAIVGTRK